MNKLVLALTYYEAPKMLAEHVKIWKTYPKNSIKVILIDDCSMEFPAQKELIDESFNVPVEIYRITKDIPQNVYGARNLAFHIALVEKAKWVLCLDIDHTLPFTGLQDFTDGESFWSPLQYYVPMREEVTPNGCKDIGCHSDSLIVDPKLFWKTGGYDEDLTGHYLHGAAFHFRRNLNSISRKINLTNLTTHFYPSSMIEDASPLEKILKTIAPDQPKNKKPTVLNFNWERTL